MRYAVQFSDIVMVDPLHPVRLLLAPVLTDTVVTVGNSDDFDCVGLLLDDSDPERLDAILRLLRSKLKQRDLRLYQSKTGKGGWKTARIGKINHEGNG